MVDLVTAGMSSDSFFSYLRDAVGSLSSDLATLVYYPLTIPTGTAYGSISITFNLLDYTMGRSTPSLSALAEQARVQVRGALAQKGVPEAQLNAFTSQVLTGLQASSSFNTTLLGLALASLLVIPLIMLGISVVDGVNWPDGSEYQCRYRQKLRITGVAAGPAGGRDKNRPSLAEHAAAFE